MAALCLWRKLFYLKIGKYVVSNQRDPRAPSGRVDHSLSHFNLSLTFDISIIMVILQHPWFLLFPVFSLFFIKMTIVLPSLWPQNYSKEGFFADVFSSKIANTKSQPYSHHYDP